MHREIGEHFTIHLDTGFVQTVHETTVRQPAHTCTGVDALNPQSPELALLLAAVAIGVLSCFDDGLLGNTEDFAPCTVVTLGLLKYLFMFGVRLHTAFYAWHLPISP